MPARETNPEPPAYAPWRRVLFPGRRADFWSWALAGAIWLGVWILAFLVRAPHGGPSGEVCFSLTPGVRGVDVAVIARPPYVPVPATQPSVSFDRYEWGLTMSWWTTVSYMVHVPASLNLTPRQEAQAHEQMARLALRKAAGTVPVPVIPALVFRRRGWALPNTGQTVRARISLLAVVGDLALLYAALCAYGGWSALARAYDAHLARRRIPPDIARIRRGLCPGCDYSVDPKWQDVCPECGRDLRGYRGETGPP